MVTVSVIIPNYNHSKYLKLRIDSVINQTYQDFELIILDDCSEDKSKDIIELYRQHPKISHIVFNSTNSGSTFKQWRLGLNAAKGKYVWFAESDDYADVTFLEKMVALLAKYTNAGLAFCNSHVVDAVGKTIGNTSNWTDFYAARQGPEKITIFNGLQFCLDHLFYLARIPNASAVLFRRAPVAQNLHWIDPKFRNSGDWKLWLHICLTSDVIWLNQDLNYFRIHGANVTGSLGPLKAEATVILKELIAEKHKYFRVYESLAAWSFKSASWTKGFKINFSNIRNYFENNLSLRSSFYLFVYLNKQLIISARKHLQKD